ncbi:MAG TPA: DUF2812 domain-containing protein [Candidatus Mediterraneibacter avicola]|nr:DUF2812 domain-containing protein [Candidatus Mediterraneibacter avicola]
MRNKEGKKVTYRFVNFCYTERGAFAEYLHKMSLKGWHFAGWKWGMVFEQGEPEDIVYDVEIFSEAGEKDLRPEEETEEYAEYCRAAGWEFVDANRKFCVFRKVSEYAVPIVTETERVEEIWKAEGKRMLIPAIIFGIFAVDYLVTAVKTGIENWLFSDLHLFILFLLPAYFLGYVLQYIFALKWYLTGKKRISSGKPVKYGLRIGYRIWNAFVNIALAVLIVWVYYLGLHKIAVIALIAVLFFGGLQAAENYFRPRRKNGRKIRRIGWGSYIVLSLFLLILLPENTSYNEPDQSILGSMEEGSFVLAEETGDKDVQFSYYLYQTDHPWVADVVWSSQKREDADMGWSSEGNLRIYRAVGQRTIRCKDAVLVLQYKSDELTDEQLHAALSRLGLQET